jgi:hypothetical protein
MPNKFSVTFLFFCISPNNLIFIVFNVGEVWYSELQISMSINLFLKCYDETSIELVIAALIYVERLLDAASKITGEDGARVTQQNAKGILLTAMTLSSKFYLDKYEKKTIFYAFITNMPRWRMREMTDQFIRMLDFNFYIREDEYKNAESHIMFLVYKGIRNIGFVPIF